MPEEIYTGILNDPRVAEGAECEVYNSAISARGGAAWSIPIRCGGCGFGPSCSGCNKCGECGCSCRFCGCGAYLPSMGTHNLTVDVCEYCDLHKNCKKGCSCKVCVWCREKTTGNCIICGCGTNCGYDCCACWKCPGCRRMVTAWRRDCGVCADCCNPSKVCSRCAAGRGGDEPTQTTTGVEFFASNLTLWRPGLGRTTFEDRRVPSWLSVKRDTSRNKLTRACSAEIEINSCDSDPDSLIREAVSRWGGSVVRDGSLNGNTGFEINTAPAGGDYLVAQITEICGVLQRLKAKTPSNTGCHVHVDAHDLGWQGLHNLCRLYRLAEPALFALVGKHRNDGRYSLLTEEFVDRLLKATDFKAAVISSVVGHRNKAGANIPKAGIELARLKGDKHAGEGASRYYALNLKAWFLHKSVEFRHHEGTADAREILGWARTCGSLVEAASKLPRKEIERLEHKGNPRGTLLECVDLAMPSRRRNYHKEWLQAKWQAADGITDDDE